MQETAIQQNTKPLDKRALTSMFMFFSFITLPISGFTMHFTYGPMTTIYHFAMTAHNFAAIIFLVSCILHITLNWKALSKQMMTKARGYGEIRKEMIIAAVVILGIVLLFSSHALHVR